MTEKQPNGREGVAREGGEAVPHLIFRLQDLFYAVDARAVREIVLLPELFPVDEVPPFVAGVLDLRGTILPVVDLGLRLGHGPHRFQIEDCVVILDTAGQSLGIIICEVRDMLDITPERIQKPYSDVSRPETGKGLLVGEVNIDGRIVMVLNPAAVHHEGIEVERPAPDPGEDEKPHAEAVDPGEGGATEQERHRAKVFCPEATPEERVIFQDRARELMQVSEGQDGEARQGFTVITLGGEFFGLALDAVNEFADVGEIAPVPCCPAHVAGYMNLRGDLLLLVDIRAILGFAARPDWKPGRVAVVRTDDFLVGVPVDDVEEVFYSSQKAVTRVPAALRKKVGEEHLLGTLPYMNKKIGILDMKGILSKEELIVDERT